MQKTNNSSIPMSIRILSGVLGVAMLFFGFFGFLLSASRGMHQQTEMFYTQKPLSEINGLAVDSAGNIYIGESESSCIQVYDPNGVFQYGFYFPTGGSGWFAFGIDENDQVHIVTARTKTHYIFKNGEVVGEEEIADYDMRSALEAQYNMIEGSTLQQGTTIYHVTFFRFLEITDAENNLISKVNLHSPIWPLPIFNFWIIAALGGAMLFVSIANSVIPGGLFPTRNKNGNKINRVRTIDKFKITTNQTTSEINLILLGLTEQNNRDIAANRKSRKSFVGRVDNNEFRISPKLNYRNNFAPVFTGKISEIETETVINIYVRPQTFVTIFMTIWMAFCGLFSFVSIIEIIMDGFRSFLLAPFIMLVFGYGVFNISFWHEEQTARQLLEKAFTKN